MTWSKAVCPLGDAAYWWMVWWLISSDPGLPYRVSLIWANTSWKKLLHEECWKYESNDNTIQSNLLRDVLDVKKKTRSGVCEVTKKVIYSDQERSHMISQLFLPLQGLLVHILNIELQSSCLTLKTEICKTSEWLKMCWERFCDVIESFRRATEWNLRWDCFVNCCFQGQEWTSEPEF